MLLALSLESRNELEKDISWCELGAAERNTARHRGSENSHCPPLSLPTAAGAVSVNAEWWCWSDPWKIKVTYELDANQ